MRSFWRIFWLESLALVRSKTLALLTLASLAWMFVAPWVFRADGTAAGARELTIRFSLGGVTALIAVALVVSATGSIARERAAKRLALTLVRPVRYAAVALGKIAAHVACAAFVLALATTVEFVRHRDDPACRHVYRPVMPSPEAEAEAMYADYMKDPLTPAAVKNAKRGVVLRLLANKAWERYDTIPTNSTWSWRFSADAIRDPVVRFRFSTAFDMREDVRGELALGDWSTAFARMTQSVVEIPLARAAAPTDPGAGGERELRFRNTGKSVVMLRPRRDVELLVPADSFRANLLRAYVELVSMLALILAFGVFLGSAFGRPTALFVAVATLVLSEMAPSIIEQYPDQLEKDRVDAIGLAITRTAAEATRPLSSLHPLESLSRDECLEPREVARVAVTDLVLAPLVFAFLAAALLPRFTP